MIVMSGDERTDVLIGSDARILSAIRSGLARAPSISNGLAPVTRSTEAGRQISVGVNPDRREGCPAVDCRSGPGRAGCSIARVRLVGAGLAGGMVIAESEASN